MHTHQIAIGARVVYRGRVGVVEDIIAGDVYRNGKPRASLVWADTLNDEHPVGGYIQLDQLKLAER